CSPMTSLKTSIKTITYLSDTGCLEIQGASLTTIHQPKDELGELAIDVLIHRITQPTLQQQRLQLTPILMERGSA
ncbi:substrate-binding domain-containing protein, partial [Escherichia coli]|uniref:substrate-binding domain-containing protein n=1 Tax=Escherichia coli TaxID=562 RepID=UPI001F2D45CE